MAGKILAILCTLQDFSGVQVLLLLLRPPC
ncbi:hypothetical protein CCACVL1_01545 [Corchorus capsularis]|uniref:Uncharacterized protein n=1 Tax=Corchorus capsularis TaxID=210143 RepID=A0A1R3KHE7_COCAP|nr:hypothetical protein CCACVL1_01545 [Corchorus capsularis]